MALRPYQLPNGKKEMRAIPDCECTLASRRGPDGGVCGACGGAIAETPRRKRVVRCLDVEGCIYPDGHRGCHRIP